MDMSAQILRSRVLNNISAKQRELTELLDFSRCVTGIETGILFINPT